MSTRLDLVLAKYPNHENGVHLLAARDPSGNQKYLDWGGRMLAAEQALAPEIADVLDLFHRFRGQRVGGRAAHRHATECIHPDVYTYRPQDFARLRDRLLTMKRARDRKQKKRERLYRIDGAVEAAVVYDSADIVVRHIMNKQASVHYGLGTRWCIAMLREGYFDDYSSQNATFFFFERKAPLGNEFDKVCLMVPRGDWAPGEDDFVAFTATDQRVGLLALAKAYGPQLFTILQRVGECSDRYPGSTIAQVYAGTASAEQLAEVFANVGSSKFSAVHEVDATIAAIVCNDAATWSLLEEVMRRAAALVVAAMKRSRLRMRYRYRRRSGSTLEIVRIVEAALAIHPNTPAEVRDRLSGQLRRRHINVLHIRRTNRDGRVGVSYDAPVREGRRGHRLRHLRRNYTAVQLRKSADRFERRASRMRKKAKALERKLAAAKKRKALATAKRVKKTKRVRT
jgi:hypothetical protein